MKIESISVICPVQYVQFKKAKHIHIPYFTGFPPAPDTAVLKKCKSSHEEALSFLLKTGTKVVLVPDWSVPKY